MHLFQLTISSHYFWVGIHTLVDGPFGQSNMHSIVCIVSTLDFCLRTAREETNVQRVPTLRGFWDLKKPRCAKFALVGL